MNGRPVILSVSNVNQYIKSLIAYDPNLSSISVRGEISNFKRYTSGHAYFSLKDATGVLKCVCFNSAMAKVDFRPSDGMRVVATGNINVYERDGVYQLYVEKMMPDGIGSLYEQFELLKKQLEKAGLFDQAHKRSLPMLPKAIGVVTSPSGAVIQDIRNVTQRRFPGMPIVLYPASVQGAGSSQEIVAAIERANQIQAVDVLIVGRGGGSIEDLWSFNEEIVAKAVYASKIPVISAVGHETDFTICDFVADLRAPTPSAAAELAVPAVADLRNVLLDYEKKLRNLPRYCVQIKQAQLDKLQANRHFTHPMDLVERREQDLIRLEERISFLLDQAGERGVRRVNDCETRLRLLNPKQVLRRGYAIVKDSAGRVLTHGAELAQLSDADVMMQDRVVHVTVEKQREESL